jgi:hypothetical protein
MNRRVERYRTNVNKMKKWLVENGYYIKQETPHSRTFIINLYFFTRLNIDLDKIIVDDYLKLVEKTMIDHPD